MSWLKNNAGSLLDIGVQLYGLNRARQDARSDRALTREGWTRSESMFRQQMDETIQRRVADAVKAGLHPLAALGISSGASSSLAGASPTGGAVTDAVRGLGEALARAEIRLKNAGAKKEESEAALADSKTATLAHHLAARGRDGLQLIENPSGNTVGFFPHKANELGDGFVFGPAEHYNPQVATSKKRGVESGTHPGTTEFEMPDGQIVRLPSSAMEADEVKQVIYIFQRFPYVLKKWGVKGAFRTWFGRWPTDEEYKKLLPYVRLREKNLGQQIRNFKKATSGRPVR